MLKGKKILITGANGFLGKHLIASLQKKDAQIKALDLVVPEKDSNEIIWLKADLLRDDIIEAFESIDIVYHLAGKYLPGNSDEIFSELCQLNVEGTKNVLSASKAAGVNKFIHISSAAVCGRDDDGVIAENDINPNDGYGLSKLKSEETVKEICKDEIDYVILRPTAFFGKNHLGSLYEMTRAIKQKKYIMIGNGNNNLNFLYVKDLVEILVKVAINPKVLNQIFIVADKPISLKKFINLTRKELNLKPTDFYIPKSLGMVLGFGFDFVSKLLHRPMPLSVRRVVNMTNDAKYSGSKILKKLSTELTYGITKGWVQTIRWYISEGLL